MLPYAVIGGALDSVEIDRGNLTCNEVIRNLMQRVIVIVSVIYHFRYLFCINYLLESNSREAKGEGCAVSQLVNKEL